MTPERVRFSSHPLPFGVTATQCLSVECGCGHVTFYLDESADGETFPSSPLQIRICVDPETWQEVDAPQRPQDVQRIVQEFLCDYPEKQREAFQARARRTQETVRRLREYRIDPREAEKGMLVAWGEIISDRNSDGVDTSSFFDYFKHEGAEYLVDDVYCANPDCPCREVHLIFSVFQRDEKPDGKTRAEDLFQAKISLNGKLQIERTFGCTRDQASGVATAWHAGFDRLDELKWRYDKVKEIAHRSCPARPAALPLPFMPPGSILEADRIGRNEPCPCGSGKKYKKCCGR